MPSLPHAAAPAGYVSYHAIAFAEDTGQAVAVGQAAPLPVGQTLTAAASTPLAGSSTTTETVGPFTPDLGRPIWLTLSGTWTGSVQVKRSIDGGATKRALTAGGETWGRFTANACEQVTVETEDGATYYLEITRASGTIVYRMAQ